LFHLLGGLGLLSLYYLLGRERALVLYAVLALSVLALELARLSFPSWNRILYARFSTFIRNNEERKLTGIVPYVSGVGLSFAFYAPPVATAAICFLATGDVTATLVGERFGRTRFNGKSLEGTAGFVAAALGSALVLSLLGLGLPAGILVLGALVAAGCELLPLPVNDNLTIPLLAGGTMELALRWLH